MVDPALDGALDQLAVVARLDHVEDQPVGLEHVLQAAGVLPPAGHLVGLHREPAVDEVLDGVGDLQLAAARGPDGLGRLHDRRGEHVDPDQGEVAARLRRLLDQGHHAAVLQLGDAVRLRVGHALEQDHRVAGAGAEAVDQLRDAVAQQVVAEVHHEGRAVEVLLGLQHGVGQAERGGLADVGHLQADRRAVADGGLDLGVGVADHDADLGDPRLAQGVEAVEEHRPVGDGHELLGARVGDRAQPRPRAAGQDQTLQRGRHGRQATTGREGHPSGPRARRPVPPSRGRGPRRVAQTAHLPGRGL